MTQTTEPSIIPVPPWLAFARAELQRGVVELPGKARNNPRIQWYHEHTRMGRWARMLDETPWCASFVTTCLAETGMAHTHSAAAKSYLTYGEPLASPQVGAIVLFPRLGGSGYHVAFVDGVERSHLLVLGGNQGNRVSIRTRGAGKAAAFRWPVPA